MRALDQHPVSYQTTATDTVGQVLAAVQSAHQPIPDDRVITSLEIDEGRRRPQNITQRVASVERKLGHAPARQAPVTGQQGQAMQQVPQR